MSDKEPIYDELIAPLMTQVIDLCKEHGVPFFITFRLNDGDEAEGDEPLFCTSYQFSDPRAESTDSLDAALLNCARVVEKGWGVIPRSFAMTVTGGA